jgi:hypothetical protein
MDSEADGGKDNDDDGESVGGIDAVMDADTGAVTLAVTEGAVLRVGVGTNEEEAVITNGVIVGMAVMVGVGTADGDGVGLASTHCVAFGAQKPVSTSHVDVILLPTYPLAQVNVTRNGALGSESCKSTSWPSESGGTWHGVHCGKVAFQSPPPVSVQGDSAGNCVEFIEVHCERQARADRGP